MLIELFNAIIDSISEWIKAHLGELFMGIAGATIVSLMPSNKTIPKRIAEWTAGLILAAALATPTAQFLTSGEQAGIFGFIYGMGGITLAKMILKAIEKRGKEEIESASGVKLDDDNT